MSLFIPNESMTDNEIFAINGPAGPSLLEIPFKNYRYADMDAWRYSHLTRKQRELNIVDIRRTPKIDRNSKCECGSGKKYKKCCGNGK